MCQEIRRHTWQAFPVRPIVCNICLRLYLNTFTYDSCLLRITISEDLNFDYLIAIISAQQLIPHTHQAISEQNTINCWGISKSYNIYLLFVCFLTHFSVLRNRYERGEARWEEGPQDFLGQCCLLCRLGDYLPALAWISTSCIFSKELPTKCVKNGQHKHSSTQHIILQILLEA